MLKFRKMHGLGNDFVILDGRGRRLRPEPTQLIRLADRRQGIGCDQIIVLESPKSSGCAVFMRIFNPDGSESGACGNATRCVADLVLHETGGRFCIIETKGGALPCQRAEMNRICVEMTRPRFAWRDIPLSQDCDTLHLPLAGDPVAVSMGNPHCVLFVDKLEDVCVEKEGKALENNPLFPERTNVEFARIESADTIRIRVWERGAGLTLACGSGACATLAAAVRRGLSNRTVEMHLDGGALTLEWPDDAAPVRMTGPVSYVFDGTLSSDYFS